MRRRGRAGRGVLAVVAAGLAIGLRTAAAQAEEAAAQEEAVVADCARSVSTTLPPLPSCAGTVPRYSACEIVLSATGSYANPFTGVNVTASFRNGTQTLLAYGFHDGGQTWRVRFAPKTAAGTSWTYTVSNDKGDTGLQILTSRSFTVGSAVSGAKGFIEVDKPNRPYYFRFSNGAPFFGIGDTSYGLVNGISDAQRKDYLNNRSQKKFNFIRFFAPGVPKNINANVPTGEGWPWVGTDYTRINPQFFRRLEHVLAETKACNLYAEVIVFNYYPTSPMPTTAWTSTTPPTVAQDLWAKYVVSRLSAYDRVFLWTVTNEYEIYPLGKYQPVTTADNTWAKDMAKKFHDFDPLKHPTTVHPFELGIGPRFGSSTEIDVLTHQNWGQNSVIGSDLCSSGSADGIDAAIRSDRIYQKPVINTEHQYEWLSDYGYPPSYAVNLACTAKARRAAWRIFVGGGATYANGFAGTWPGKDPYTHQTLVGARFTLRDEGMGTQVAHYAAFVNNTDYRTMNPANPGTLCTPSTALCLAKPGSEYVVYAPTGGPVSLDLTGQSGTFAVTRLDPRTGTTIALSAITGGGWRSLAAPAGEDYVFRVKRQVVTLTAPDATAHEAGPGPGVFQLTCSGNTAGPLTVSFSRGGSAAQSDFTPNPLGTTKTIPAGASSATLTLTPVNDTLPEADETVSLTLQAGSGYTLGSPSAATVTIVDNE